MRNFALTLIILGLLALAIPYFSYTKKDKVLDVGSVEAFKTEEKTVPIPPIAGVVTVGVGVLLLLGSSIRKR